MERGGGESGVDLAMNAGGGAKMACSVLPWRPFPLSDVALNLAEKSTSGENSISELPGSSLPSLRGMIAEGGPHLFRLMMVS